MSKNEQLASWEDRSKVKRSTRLGLAAIALTSVVVGAVLPGPALAHGASAECQTSVFKVALQPNGPKDERVEITECTPDGRRPHGKHDVAVVVTPGATYDARKDNYWDWPQQPEKYSYREAAAERGIAVINYTPVGRVGTGSSYPESTKVTTEASARVLDQVIRHALNKGYDDIYSAGHSVGAGVAVKQAAMSKGTNTYPKGVLVQDYRHGYRVSTAVQNVQANTVPKFVKYNLDNGYNTTAKGTRSNFYGPFDAQKVIDYDAANQNVVPAATVATYAGELGTPPANNIAGVYDGPVWVGVGKYDKIFCDHAGAPAGTISCTDIPGSLQQEKQYYHDAESVNYKVYPHAGHDVNLSPDAQQVFQDMNNWIWQQEGEK